MYTSRFVLVYLINGCGRLDNSSTASKNTYVNGPIRRSLYSLPYRIEWCATKQWKDVSTITSVQSHCSHSCMRKVNTMIGSNHCRLVSGAASSSTVWYVNCCYGERIGAGRNGCIGQLDMGPADIGEYRTYGYRLARRLTPKPTVDTSTQTSPPTELTNPSNLRQPAI